MDLKSLWGISMREKFIAFFKERRGLTAFVLFLAILVFVISTSAALFVLTPNGKKLFLGTFLIAFGAIMFVFGRKSKNDASPKEKTIEPHSVSRSYRKLLDEVEYCSKELKKHLTWAYGCLMVGWVVFLIGKWSDHPPYNHPVIAGSIFILALLAATKYLEEDDELDTKIATCIAEGVEMERNRQELRSSHFLDLAKSYEGWGMWQFAFIRVSPPLMIIFSLFNSDLIFFLSEYLSTPTWIISCGIGMILGLAFLFLARMACRPYQRLLERTKIILAK